MSVMLSGTLRSPEPCQPAATRSGDSIEGGMAGLAMSTGLAMRTCASDFWLIRAAIRHCLSSCRGKILWKIEAYFQISKMGWQAALSLMV